MSLAVETSGSRVPLPLPSHFSYAEQSFSLKKRRFPFSSSCMSNSPCSSPARLLNCLPPMPPSKGCPPLSRVFPQQPSPWTPLSNSLSKSPNSVYDPSKQKSYFSQCFTNLGLVGRGSFGEVYKVLSNEDGRLYAVKRSAQRFRGKSERKRSEREARNHERICPHPHILDFVAAWEERGRLYIQTELCSTSLLLHAENKLSGPDEPAAWAYLCDLLSALEHLHSQGFVHLDLKPANVLITSSGRLKLGDFGLLLELKKNVAEHRDGKAKEDAQEGDPRYMAPELLRGEYGPAADVFSLGVSILELACNIDVPNGGEGWQQLRQGQLPSECTKGLSADLQSVLKMMLVPEPSDRPTVSELLQLPSVRKRRWKRHIYLMVVETMLTLVSFCQFLVCYGRRFVSSLSFLSRWTKTEPCTPPKDSWDKNSTYSLSTLCTDPGSLEDDAVFLHHTDPEISPTVSQRVKSRLVLESTSTPIPGSAGLNHQSRPHTPIRSLLDDFSSCDLGLTQPSVHFDGMCHAGTPNKSPILPEQHIGSFFTSSMERCGNNFGQTEKLPTRAHFEPKNLLSLFEETAVEGHP